MIKMCLKYSKKLSECLRKRDLSRGKLQNSTKNIVIHKNCGQVWITFIKQSNFLDVCQ